MDGFIYKITNDINGKIYIGKTLNSLEHRFNEHKRASRKKYCENRPLYSAMRKYGVENFSITLIEKASIEILAEREIYWINYYKTYGEGYNATLGGEGAVLYNYNDIINGFLSGKIIKELAEEFECSPDTISRIIRLKNLDAKENAIAKTKKGLVAKDKSGNVIRNFSSRAEAARWLQENGYTKSNDLDNIVAAIGRAANGQRATAYGFIWENN